jgi:hypothetical protein
MKHSVVKDRFKETLKKIPVHSDKIKITPKESLAVQKRVAGEMKTFKIKQSINFHKPNKERAK